MLGNWSTGSKVALATASVIGGLYLLGIVAAYGTYVAEREENKKSRKESLDNLKKGGADEKKTAVAATTNPQPATPSSAPSSAPAPAPKPAPSAAKDSAAQKRSAGAVSTSCGLPGAVDLNDPEAFEAHVKRAWDHWNKLGAPKYHVAPMVDQSELPFRQLCRRYGAQAAYSPMLHSRLFSQSKGYREDVFSTCAEDRPLFIQFCGDDPAIILRAAKLVEDKCDYVDLNTGCPQRIAKRGHYGAFLMEEWDLLERIIRHLSTNLKTPVSVKIRVFPEVEKTVRYAQMFERAGASLIAVHGRTREQKDNSATRADWDQIKAVKSALKVPVIANGNIRDIHDANACLEYTGCDAVMSAESLLANPALFDPKKLAPGYQSDPLERIRLAREYLEIAREYPTAFRMVRGHLWSMLGDWAHEFEDLRKNLNNPSGNPNDVMGRIELMLEQVKKVETEVERIVREEGRTMPKPKLSKEEKEALEKEERRKNAIDEANREEEGLNALGDGAEEEFCCDFDSLGCM